MSKVLWFMHALGKAGLPAQIESAGKALRLEKTVKHDFYAATGFYADDSGAKYVVKINRRVALVGLRLVGRYLRYREVRAYARLQDLPNIPRLIGDATSTGFVHSYVDGQPLQKGMTIPDSFFDELIELVRELDRRGIAYVDTNKPSNILMGVDGKPYLIDFQIHFDAGAWWPGSLGRYLLRIFHRADVYHVLKNKRRFRPDLLTDEERAIVEKRGFFVRAHRTLTRPYFWVRRPVMKWLQKSGRVADAGSE